jgi:hypothetical protein
MELSMPPTRLAERAVLAPAATATASSYVEEYLVHLESGEGLNLAAFLDRVPDRLREAVFEGIDRALANQDLPGGAPAATPPEPPRAVHTIRPVHTAAHTPAPAATTAEQPASAEEPETAPAIVTVETPPRPRGDRVVRKLARILVPRAIRPEFTAEMLQRRAELFAVDPSRLRVLFETLRLLAVGFAQRAPLSSPGLETNGPVTVPPHTQTAVTIGLLAWRTAGPVLLLAGILGGMGPWLLGVGLLGAAFAALVLVVATRSEPYAASEVTLANRVLGGTLIALGGAAVAGLGTVALIALGAAFDSTWISSAAVRLLLVAATVTAAVVSGSGWTPEPWLPRRLIRV